MGITPQVLSKPQMHAISNEHSTVAPLRLISLASHIVTPSHPQPHCSVEWNAMLSDR